MGFAPPTTALVIDGSRSPLAPITEIGLRLSAKRSQQRERSHEKEAEMTPCTDPRCAPWNQAEAALFLAALGRAVDRRYEAGRADAADLDAALEEELDRVDAFQSELLEDFDPLEELEPDELYALDDETALWALLAME